MTVNKKTNIAAYTLIEILIVVLIISIIATFASLMFSKIMQKQQAQTVANDLATIIPVAQQQAILQPTTLGIFFDKHYYAFYKWAINPTTHSYNWLLITHDRIFKTYNIPQNVTVLLKSPASKPTDDETTKIPQINFLSNGSMTAFTIDISEKNKPLSYELIGKENGEIQLKKITHDE